MTDSTGRVTSVSTIARDITRRKNAEATVRDERDRAQQYLDTAEVILLRLDIHGRILLVNRYACAVLGWTADELLGQDWIETCVPAWVRDESRTKLHNLFVGDLSITESPVLARSGEVRLFEWRRRVLRDDEGHTIGSFSSGTDITERHLAAEALRQAEERMRFALEGAEVGIWDMDCTTQVVRWSEILEAQYCLAAGTSTGTLTSLLERVHPDDRESVVATVGKAMASGGDFSILHRTLCPDGTLRWLSGAGRVLLDEHGEPVRAVGISLDVTERHTLQEQYQQAQKMEAIGRLAGGVGSMSTRRSTCC